MTYSKIVTAVPALQKLVNQELPLLIAYKLTKIVQKVNGELDFFSARSSAIYSKYEDQRDPACAAEINELLQMEIEWGIPPLQINIHENVRLTCSEIDMLDGLIEFVDEEDG